MISGTASKNMRDKVTLSWNSPSVSLPRQTPQPSSKPQDTAAPAATAETPREAPQAPEKKPAPAPAPESEPKAPQKETDPQKEPQKKEEAPQKEPLKEEVPQKKEAATPENKPEPPAKKTGGWGAAVVDFILVMLLLGLIGGAAWYIHQQTEMYRVPSPLELAQQEQLELCKQHVELQDAAYKADEQLHMRQRITHLELQQEAVQRQLAEHKQGIAAERERVFSIQREIIQEDKTSRSVAKTLLIGLPVGNVSTTNGRAYHNAIIHRLEGGRITLRTPQGQVRFPVAQLVKDNLPDMVRYAFGLDDMVDMSDFEAAPGSPAPRKRSNGKIIVPRKPSTQVTEPNYEPEAGAPIVEAPTKPATITVEPGLTPEDDGSWQPPQEALPIGE